MNLRVPALVALAPLVLLPLAARSEALLDRVAAVVDGEVITLSEVEARARIYRSVSTGMDRTDALKGALSDLIDEALIEAQLAARQMAVGEADIDAAIERVMQQNGMTETAFRQALEMQGYTWEGYREEMGRQIKQVRFLQEQVGASVNITDEDVRGYLARTGQGGGAKEVDVSNLLLRVPPEASDAEVEAVRGRAEAALERIRAGAPFEDVARELGEDATAPEGGRLGWVGRGVMVEPFERAVFAATVGEPTGPVRTRFGWHLVLVHDTRLAEAGDAMARQRARRQLEQEELERQTRRVLDALRKKAVIDIKLEALAS